MSPTAVSSFTSMTAPARARSGLDPHLCLACFPSLPRLRRCGILCSTDHYIALEENDGELVTSDGCVQSYHAANRSRGRHYLTESWLSRMANTGVRGAH